MKNNILAQLSGTSLGKITPPSEAFSAGSADDVNLAAKNLETFISTAIGALTIIGGLLFVFWFVMGGLNWITAGGDKGKIEKARDQMVQGIMGMIVIVISYALIGIVSSFLGLHLLNPGQAILDLWQPPQSTGQLSLPPPQ